MDPGQPVRLEPSLSYRFTRGLARVVTRLLYRFEVVGGEHLPARGGAVVAYNHQSFLDPIIAAISTPRELTWIARTTLNASALYRFLTRPAPVVSIQPGRADKGALDVVVDRARRGAAIALFPEETRTRDGAIGALKGGFFLIAQRAEVPVIPAYIGGTYAIWSRHRKLPRLTGSIEVRYGAPFSVGQLDRSQAIEQLRARLCVLGDAAAVAAPPKPAASRG